MRKFKLLLPLFLLLGIFVGCKSGARFEYRADEGGYVVGNYLQQIGKGKSGLEVEAIAKDGYEFIEWSDGVKTAKRTDAGAGEDTLLTASFRKIGSYRLEYRAEEGGFIVGNSSQQLLEGERGLEVEAIPKEGYEFSAWSDGSESAKRADGGLSSDTTLTASFKKIEVYTLTYEATEGGFIVGDPTQDVRVGESGLEVEAIAKNGYEFVEWSDGVASAKRKEENVSESRTLTAKFALIEYYTLSYVAETGGYVVGESSQEVLRQNIGSEVRAVPQVGYVFKSWSDGNTSDTRRDDFGSAGKTFSAVFEKDIYNLPVFDITTKDNAPILDKEHYVECTVTLSNADEYDFSAYTAGIRLRGNSTMQYPKKPYRLKFDNKISPFGWSKNKSWVLLAMYYDFSDVKDYLAHHLAKELIRGDGFVPNTQYVEVYLNGAFKGLYLFTDQIDEKEGRLNVECDFTAEDEEIPFYVELDVNSQWEGEEGSEWFRIENEDSGETSYFEVKYPEAEDRQTQAQFDYIKNYIEKVNELCHDPRTTRVDFEKYVELDTFIDYYLMQELVGQIDINYKSIHMSKTKTGKLKMGPVWDFDWSMGGPMDKWWQGHKVADYWFSDSNWFHFMMQKSWFVSLVKARWSQFQAPVKKVLKEVRAQKGYIMGSALRNAAMWDFDKTDSLLGFSELFDFVTDEYFTVRTKYMDALLKQAGTGSATFTASIPRRRNDEY